MRFRMQLFLTAVLSIHAFFLCKQLFWSAEIFSKTLLMTAERRRYLTMPGLYQGAERLNHVVPPEATLWFVSPQRPTDIGYFIFPRMLCWGSPLVRERDAVRHQHPGDWILTNRSSDPRDDVLELFPPVAPALRR